MQIELKATVLASAVSVCVLAMTFGLSPLLRSTETATSNRKVSTNTGSFGGSLTLDRRSEQGHKLFDRNCAHCHGDDARGEEGPSLYNLTLSDARIAKRIREGIKGEMPRFGSKFNDADIAALIAFLRTLKE
jgi:cytochrome c2